MPEVSPTIGEMWPSMSRVEYHSEFEPVAQEVLLQFEILSRGAVILHDQKENVARR
jgi:hypothetical protein